MIYIVEVPHQRRPLCWTANCKQEACSILTIAHSLDEGTPNDWWNFDAWMDYLASDLFRLHVFLTDAEAIQALSDDTFDHHQGAQARVELVDKLIGMHVINNKGLVLVSG